MPGDDREPLAGCPACLLYGSVDLAVQEVHRVAKMGLKGLELSCSWDMEPMFGIPAGSRSGRLSTRCSCRSTFILSPRPRRARQEAPQARRAAMFTGVSAFQMGLIHIIAGMMGAGVLQFDPVNAKLIDDIGVEMMIGLRTTPHTDGIWPESTKYIEEQFAGLTPEVVHKINCENAVKF
ncbi:MAG: hypothetical protein JO139_18360 [Alphaproteobacteria bacterium]|nr:hypothetical protein [Alphaproteobacteria bacterium]